VFQSVAKVAPLVCATTSLPSVASWTVVASKWKTLTMVCPWHLPMSDKRQMVLRAHAAWTIPALLRVVHSKPQ